MNAKPIFIGEFDGRPLKVKRLTSKINSKGQPYFYFWFPLYFTDWDGSRVEFQEIKVQSYGKCDFKNGDLVYLTDFPKGKWISFYRYRKVNGTYDTIITIFANVSREKVSRNILKEKEEDDE